MGIYGMGKAFNLRYANSGQFRPIHVRRPPARPMCGGHAVSYTETTNVTIKNGPSGFWGFLGGLFGGLFGGGMGGGMSMGMGMPMGMPMGGMSPFGMLNTQMPQQTSQQPKTDELGNLQKMYSKYTVLNNNDGTYTLTTGKGDNVKTGTYAELMKGMNEPPQGTGKEKTTKTTEETDPKSKTDPEITPKNDKLKASDINGYTGNMSVHDDVRGSQYDINGSSTISKDTDKETGFPKKITVKGNNYEYQRTEDGVPIYKSLDGAGDEYRLEKDANGKFALNQYEGDKGAGTADISTKKHGSTSINNGNNNTETSTSTTEQKITIKQEQIQKNVDGSYSYTYVKVPNEPVTVNITMWEAQGLTQAQIQEKLQEKLDAALG